MSSSSTLRTYDGYEHLLRFCNLYYPQFPVILFNDRAGIVDLDEGRRISLSTTMTSLDITVSSDQGLQSLVDLEDRIARQISKIATDETFDFKWERKQAGVL